jgi:hypothetical protein
LNKNNRRKTRLEVQQVVAVNVQMHIYTPRPRKINKQISNANKNESLFDYKQCLGLSQTVNSREPVLYATYDWESSEESRALFVGNPCQARNLQEMEILAGLLL